MSVSAIDRLRDQRRDDDQSRLTHLFLKGRGRDAMTPDDAAILEDSIDEVRSIPARTIVIRRDERVRHSSLLLEGVMCRYMDDRHGNRQIVAFHVPGDFVDLHGFAMRHLDHDVATLTPVRVALAGHDRLEEIVAHRPRLTRLLWFSTLLDAAMHREWVFRLGRLEADGRVAHLFCELHARLSMVDLVHDGAFRFPVTQIDLAEAVGITPVHLNRVLRSLRERGLMTFRTGEARILDLDTLAALADFDPGYLYGGGPTLERHGG
ncbi:Crp/Fnr family transcriptional regulator [Sphingomonas fuzhouensis]|uniref:Crp/Fnr family transcriptional regulator n=1 Tax=Sphingomonas fuzhouensis TaxID=3106033 RepID=UPI002AFDE761|nr:Crp/Fnr family transcriptional regulator [Sphingomonas sp. SGZ-02]